jgi:hypothetical protein
VNNLQGEFLIAYRSIADIDGCRSSLIYPEERLHGYVATEIGGRQALKLILVKSPRYREVEVVFFPARKNHMFVDLIRTVVEAMSALPRSLK